MPKGRKSVLKDKVVAIERTKIITAELTQEHRELLAKATTHGKKLCVTGGLHLTSDDIFISAEMSLREKEKIRLTTEKNRHQRMMTIEAKAKLVLDTKGYNSSTWLVMDLDAVLAWYGIRKLNTMSKANKIQKWT